MLQASGDELASGYAFFSMYIERNSSFIVLPFSNRINLGLCLFLLILFLFFFTDKVMDWSKNYF